MSIKIPESCLDCRFFYENETVCICTLVDKWIDDDGDILSKPDWCDVEEVVIVKKSDKEKLDEMKKNFEKLYETPKEESPYEKDEPKKIDIY